MLHVITRQDPCVTLGVSPVGVAGGVHPARSSGSGGDSDGNDVVDVVSGVLMSGGVGGTVNIWQVRLHAAVVGVDGGGWWWRKAMMVVLTLPLSSSLGGHIRQAQNAGQKLFLLLLAAVYST